MQNGLRLTAGGEQPGLCEKTQVTPQEPQQQTECVTNYMNTHQLQANEELFFFLNIDCICSLPGSSKAW